MRVAAHLGIPFHTLDASRQYKASVIDYLIREYGAGRTPNPDIMCNRDVKFGTFYDFARAHGADAIATGHYARQEGDSLLRGVDESKDQSYFLWAISPDALAYTLFPLGGMYKQEVRARAEHLALPNATKKDSQGICFLGPVSMDDFLRAELPNTPGEALNAVGERVGEHEGVLLATLGERVALTDAPPGPWYVVAKDVRANTLTVAAQRTLPPESMDIHLTDTNWFAQPEATTALSAQYRYHGPLICGTMHDGNRFASSPRTEPVAPGQSLVLYDGDRVLGGGIIT